MNYCGFVLFWHQIHNNAWYVTAYNNANTHSQTPLTALCPGLPGWTGQQEGHPACKNEWWGTGMVICLEQDGDLHMAQLMPLPLTVSCFSKIQTGFTFLVPAHPGNPRKRAVKRVCVWYQPTQVVLKKRPLNVCVCVILWNCRLSNSKNIRSVNNCQLSREVLF